LQNFQGQENGFKKSNISNLHLDNPISFWKCYFGHLNHDELTQLAVRILETVANLVALERAFSAMNFIVTKLQNRLGVEKADKLIFIYMN
jgi:hypothetical protein